MPLDGHNGPDRANPFIFRGVLAIRGAHGDQAGELRARNNLAIAYQHQGRYAESLRESDRTKAIAEKLGDMALLGILLKNSADTCQLMGDLEGALIRGSEAVRVLAESQDRHRPDGRAPPAGLERRLSTR